MLLIKTLTFFQKYLGITKYRMNKILHKSSLIAAHQACEQEPEEDVCLIDVGIAGWNLFDLLGVLDHFAVNESKGLIFKKAG